MAAKFICGSAQEGSTVPIGPRLLMVVLSARDGVLKFETKEKPIAELFRQELREKRKRERRVGERKS